MAPGTQPGSPGRIHGIDALRGIAALAVLLYHVVFRYQSFIRGQDPEGFLFPGFREVELGIMPVLWFFLISGFVIALTLERCAGPLDFAWRRAARIFPAYWAAIALFTLIGLTAPVPFTEPPTLGLVLINLTMLQTFLGVPHLDGVFWSLAVELVFYAWAFATFAAGLRARLHLVALVWAVACLAAAVAEKLGQPLSWQIGRLALLAYGPLLCGGMMIHRLWRGQHRAASAATLCLCAAAVTMRFPPITAASCILAAAFVAWSAFRRPAILVNRPLLFLGEISFSLYLSHQTTSYAVLLAAETAGLPRIAGIGAAIAVSLALATVLCFTVEQPALAAAHALRRRARRLS